MLAGAVQSTAEVLGRGLHLQKLDAAGQRRHVGFLHHDFEFFAKRQGPY